MLRLQCHITDGWRVATFLRPINSVPRLPRGCAGRRHYSGFNGRALKTRRCLSLFKGCWRRPFFSLRPLPDPSTSPHIHPTEGGASRTARRTMTTRASPTWRARCRVHEMEDTEGLHPLFVRQVGTGRCKQDQAQRKHTIFPRFRAQDAKPLHHACLIFLIDEHLTRELRLPVPMHPIQFPILPPSLRVSTSFGCSFYTTRGRYKG
jgi:hypothetical protein